MVFSLGKLHAPATFTVLRRSGGLQACPETGRCSVGMGGWLCGFARLWCINPDSSDIDAAAAEASAGSVHSSVPKAPEPVPQAPFAGSGFLCQSLRKVDKLPKLVNYFNFSTALGGGPL